MPDPSVPFFKHRIASAAPASTGLGSCGPVMERPRVLCHINHYFGTTSTFVGRSTSGAEGARRTVVQAVLAKLRSLPYEMDIRVCGFPTESLLPIDLDVSRISDPRLIVYESIERMFDSTEAYDLFLNIEDDIIVSDHLIDDVLGFSAVSELSELFLPNRMEPRADGGLVCVDLEAMPGWLGLERAYRDLTLDVAVNSHSGLFLLTRAQMRYAASRVNLRRRERFVGGFMASAYANILSTFLVWRSKSDLMAHHVTHADKWLHSAEELDAMRRLLGERGVQQATSPTPQAGAPLGYVDTISVEGLVGIVRGWAIEPSGAPLPPSRVQVGSHWVSDFTLHRHDRPDVMELYPQAQASAGFEIQVPLLELPPAALAAESFAIYCNSATQDEAALSFASSLAWPSLQAREAVANAPTIPDKPWLPDAAAARLGELLSRARCFLEYGSGGTTMMAARAGVPALVTTESDRTWLSAVRHKLRSVGAETRAALLHVNIGATGEWGFPRSDAMWRRYFEYPIAPWTYCLSQGLDPDVVLVDGRFRVACFLASLAHSSAGTRILFDDYAERPYYHVVETFMRPVAYYDRMAEFLADGQPAPRDLWLALLGHASDAR